MEGLERNWKDLKVLEITWDLKLHERTWKNLKKLERIEVQALEKFDGRKTEDRVTDKASTREACAHIFTIIMKHPVYSVV